MTPERKKIEAGGKKMTPLGRVLAGDKRLRERWK
jgi:hypothetical protein